MEMKIAYKDVITLFPKHVAFSGVSSTGGSRATDDGKPINFKKRRKDIEK